MGTKKGSIIILTIALLLPAAGFSQITDTPLQNTAPPSPVGSGARAMGTGGAFIAIADDATATNWNPGGLTQLVLPETSVVYDYEHINVNGDDTDFANINYLSVVYPFSVGPVNVVTAASFQRLYDFYFDSDFNTENTITSTTATMIISGIGGAVVDHFSDSYTRVGTDKIKGEVGAFSPALAIQLGPQFSIGGSWNIWRDGIVGPSYQRSYNHTKVGHKTQDQDQYLDDSAPFCTCNGGGACNDGDIIDDPSCLGGADTYLGNTPAAPVDYKSVYTSDQHISFEGQNFNVGFLWRVTPRFTVGGVYRTQFTAHLKRTVAITQTSTVPPGPPITAHYKYHEDMTFPASYGVGTAFRFSDALTVAADATRIEWDKFTYEYENGKEISPVNGISEKDANVDPTMTYRLGVEYLVIQPAFVIPIRGGFFYDPEPARDKPDDYYGFSLGTGIAYDKMILDLTYWYRWGNDVVLSTTYDPVKGKVVREDRGDVNRQMIMLSAVLHMG